MGSPSLRQAPFPWENEPLGEKTRRFGLNCPIYQMPRKTSSFRAGRMSMAASLCGRLGGFNHCPLIYFPSFRKIYGKDRPNDPGSIALKNGPRGLGRKSRAIDRVDGGGGGAEPFQHLDQRRGHSSDVGGGRRPRRLREGVAPTLESARERRRRRHSVDCGCVFERRGVRGGIGSRE